MCIYVGLTHLEHFEHLGLIAKEKDTTIIAWDTLNFSDNGVNDSSLE